MINEYSFRDKLTLILLATGVCYFGVIFPDSLSDHTKLVHFAAHFGMSFLFALSFYLLSTIKLKRSKTFSYTLLILATLFIGVIYKYWEISTQGQFQHHSFYAVLQITGVFTSMSQNLSGVMAAMFLIESLVDKNLVMTVAKSGKLRMNNLHIGNMSNRVGKIKLGNSFSASSKN